MRRLFSALCGCGVFVGLAAHAADAKYKVCNRIDKPVEAAFGLGTVTQDPTFGTGHFTRQKSKGWTPVDPGKCKIFTFDQRYIVYFFARNKERVWEGSDDSFCIYDGQFDHGLGENVSEDDCKNQLGTEEGKEMRWVGFQRFKPGDVIIGERPWKKRE